MAKKQNKEDNRLLLGSVRMPDVSNPSRNEVFKRRSAVSDDWEPSKELLDAIKSYEKFSPVVYKDGNGIETIGYGITDKKIIAKYRGGKRMSKREAERLFNRHVDDVIAQMKDSIPNFNAMSNNQKDAMTSYVYNVGIGGVTRKSPKLMEALENKNWKEAAKQMDFGYNDKNNSGLRRRRDEERALFTAYLDMGLEEPTEEELAAAHARMQQNALEDILSSRNELELQDPLRTKFDEAYRVAMERKQPTFTWNGREFATDLKAEGGPVATFLHNITHPRDAAYAIMKASGASSQLTVPEIIDALAGLLYNNYTGNKEGEKSSFDYPEMYIYGKSEGAEELSEEEKEYGVDYSAYLKEHGRDPKKVKQYKGNFGADIILPESAKNYLDEIVGTDKNFTIGYMDASGTDDVAGHLGRINKDKNGEYIISYSDLWDFEPESYAKDWAAGNLAQKGFAYTQAWLLDKIGNPFIVRSNKKVKFIPDSEYDSAISELLKSDEDDSKGIGYYSDNTYKSLSEHMQNNGRERTENIRSYGIQDALNMISTPFREVANRADGGPVAPRDAIQPPANPTIDFMNLIGESIPYDAGTLPDINVIMDLPPEEYRDAMRKAAARRGRNYVYQAQEEAAPLIQGLAGAAAAASLVSAGLFQPTMNFAADFMGMLENPLDPVNYLPYADVSRIVRRTGNYGDFLSSIPNRSHVNDEYSEKVRKFFSDILVPEYERNIESVKNTLSENGKKLLDSRMKGGNELGFTEEAKKLGISDEEASDIQRAARMQINVDLIKDEIKKPSAFEYNVKDVDRESMASYNPSDGNVYVSKLADAIGGDVKFSSLIHEFRHKMDSRGISRATMDEMLRKFALSSNEEDILESAYKSTGSTNEAGELTEKIATNAEFKARILRNTRDNTNLSAAPTLDEMFDTYNVTEEEFRSIVDNISDDELLNLLSTTNDYGRDYASYIEGAKNSESKKRTIDAIRKAVTTIPFTAYSAYQGFSLMNDRSAREEDIIQGGTDSDIETANTIVYNNIRGEMKNGGKFSDYISQVDGDNLIDKLSKTNYYGKKRANLLKLAKMGSEKAYNVLIDDLKEKLTQMDKKQSGGYVASRDATTVGAPEPNPNAPDITNPSSGVDISEIVAGGIPVVGDVMDVRDFLKSAKDRDAVGMFLSGIGLIPVFGGFGKQMLNTRRIPNNLTSRDKELLDAMPEYANPNSPAGEAWLNHKKRLISGAYKRLVGEDLILHNGEIDPSQLDTKVYDALDPVIIEEAKRLELPDYTEDEIKDILENSEGYFIVGSKIAKGKMEDIPKEELFGQMKDMTDEEMEDMMKSHEIEHLVHYPDKAPSKDAFSIDRIIEKEDLTDDQKEELRRYFKQASGTELSARGTQIKDYFGLTDDSQEVTPEMLEYASRHYIEDYGDDNMMSLFFDGIVDYKKMAKWITDHASVGLGVYFLNEAGQRVTQDELEEKKQGGFIYHSQKPHKGDPEISNVLRYRSHKFYIYGGKMNKNDKKQNGGSVSPITTFNLESRELPTIEHIMDVVSEANRESMDPVTESIAQMGYVPYIRNYFQDGGGNSDGILTDYFKKWNEWVKRPKVTKRKDSMENASELTKIQSYYKREVVPSLKKKMARGGYTDSEIKKLQEIFAPSGETPGAESLDALMGTIQDFRYNIFNATRNDIRSDGNVRSVMDMTIRYTPPEDFLTLLRNTNGFGADYARRIDRMPESVEKDDEIYKMRDAMADAVSYAPVGLGAAYYNSTTDDEVVRQMGGLVQHWGDRDWGPDEEEKTPEQIKAELDERYKITPDMPEADRLMMLNLRSFQEGGDLSNEYKVKYLYDLLLNEAGMSQTQALAVLGNLWGESQWHENASGDTNTSYGIQQWHGERRKKLIEFAKQRSGNEDPTFWDQAHFLVKEYKEGQGFLDDNDPVKLDGYLSYSKNDFQNAESLHDAVVAWNQGFGRPHKKVMRTEDRYKGALKAAEMLGITVDENLPSFYGINGINEDPIVPAFDSFAVTATKPSGAPTATTSVAQNTGEEEDIPTVPGIENMTREERQKLWFETYGKQMVEDYIAEENRVRKEQEDARRLQYQQQAEAQAARDAEAAEQARRQAIIEQALDEAMLNIPGMARGK